MHRRVEESFWRQGDSDYVKPLPRHRKRPRLRRLSRSEGSDDSSGEDLAGEHDDADPALFHARQAALARHAKSAVDAAGGPSLEGTSSCPARRCVAERGVGCAPCQWGLAVHA